MAIVANTVEKLLLAAPRGYCAGVDRAVQTVERALEIHGAPVYVRKEIVHNKHVVETLRERGAIFVEEETEVPEGRRVRVLRARRRAERARRRDRPRAAHDRRDLSAGDEGAPRGRALRAGRLHDRARRPRRPRGGRRHDGRGARAHRARAERGRTSTSCRSTDPERVAYITQTTLAVDETTAILTTPARTLSRRSSVRAPTTSVTRRPTARRPSSRWPTAATCCS